MENKDIIKYGLIIGGGGLAAWGLTRLANFKDTADKLSVNVTKFDIDLKGLEYLKFLINLYTLLVLFPRCWFPFVPIPAF